MNNLRKATKPKTGLSTKVYKPLVYICAPYSGDLEENIKKARIFARFVYDNDCIPMTPHLMFPFLDDSSLKERKDAMFMDKVLLGKCDEVWVLSETITKGMAEELGLSNKRRQKVRYFNNDFVEVESVWS